MSCQNFGYECKATRYEGLTIEGDGISLDVDTKIGGCVAPNLADLELKDDIGEMSVYAVGVKFTMTFN